MPAKREPQEGDVVMILPMCAYNPDCWVCEQHTGKVGVATAVKYGTITVRGNKTNTGGVSWDTKHIEVLQHA